MERFWYWLFVVAYCLAMIAVGLVIRRRQDKARGSFEFWIAQRQLPGWQLGISLTAGWLMLGWISYGMSQVYTLGATGLWVLPIPWFVLCFIIVAMVPWVRRLGAVSLPQAIEQRFGLSARVLLAALSFYVFIVWTQAELFMAGTLAAPFLGLTDARWAMVLIVCPVLLYSVLGGFRAIVTTDLLQFLLMAVFMVVLAVQAIGAAGQASGGDIIGAIRRATLPGAAEPGGAFGLWSAGAVFPAILLLGFLPGWMIEQDLALRIQAARSTAHAFRGALMALVMITVFVLVLPSTVAFCSLVVFPPVNGAPPEAIGADATGIIAAHIAQLPLWLSVFMVVGLVACQMSTVDTFANVSAMPLAYDIIEPLLLRGRGGDHSGALGRVMTVIVVLIALGLAMVSTSLGDVYNISSGVLSACIAVPALFVFWRRTTLPAVLCASVAGFAATVAMYYYELHVISDATGLPRLLQGSYGYNYVVTGVVASVAVIVPVSLLTRRSAAEKLASVRAAPLDDTREFAAAAAVAQEE